MNKRGPIIGIAGVVLVAISLGVAYSAVPNLDPTMGGEFFVPDLFEGMFDQITSETIIYENDSTTFSYSTTESGVPLLWGLQITDYQDGDKISVKISNIYGDEIESSIQGAVQDGPMIFDMFMIPKNDVYNFHVTNLGDRPIAVVMMFSEDPDNSEALQPDSALMNTLMPLAISGIFLIVGIIVIIVGVSLTIIDWKKREPV